MAGLTGVFLIATFGASWYLVGWPLLRSAVNDFSSLIVISAQAWVELPEDRHEALQVALWNDYQLEMDVAGPPLRARESWKPYIHLLEERISQRLGKPVKVLVRDDEPDLYWVDLPMDEVTLRAQFHQDRIGTRTPIALIFVLGMSLLLAVAAAIYLARRLTKPLLDLGKAAQAVGRGETPALPQTQGVRELDDLISRFNAMAQDVRDLVHNRTTLLAGISHDLRSPITRLRMALELARARATPALFDDMESYLDQMNRLIGEFLSYSQGLAPQPKQTIPLKPFVETLVSSLSDKIQLDCGEGECDVDSAALERVIRNLVENAIKHGQDQPVMVHSYRQENNWIIEVADRGPGIPDAYKEKVFEPFFRVEGSRNPQTGGTGLGLAIVREICRAQGWQAKLLDREGGGLVVRLELPNRGL